MSRELFLIRDNDSCVDWFNEHYEDFKDLCNYEVSDFVNLDMCYTYDLLKFYEKNRDDVLYWVDDFCECVGYTSRLQAVEGDFIEDPEDFSTALVNCAMTHLGRTLFAMYEDNKERE